MASSSKPRNLAEDGDVSMDISIEQAPEPQLESVRKVFDTAELAEMIMLWLPLRDLVLVERTSRLFRAAAASSSKIQTVLFLRPRNSLRIRPFWSLRGRKPVHVGIANEIWGTHHDGHSLVYPPLLNPFLNHLTGDLTCAYLTTHHIAGNKEESSLKRMIFTHPPSHELSVDCKAFMHQHVPYRTLKTGHKDFVRISDVKDLLDEHIASEDCACDSTLNGDWPFDGGCDLHQLGQPGNDDDFKCGESETSDDKEDSGEEEEEESAAQPGEQSESQGNEQEDDDEVHVPVPHNPNAFRNAPNVITGWEMLRQMEKHSQIVFKGKVVDCHEPDFDETKLKLNLKLKMKKERSVNEEEEEYEDEEQE